MIVVVVVAGKKRCSILATLYFTLPMDVKFALTVFVNSKSAILTADNSLSTSESDGPSCCGELQDSGVVGRSFVGDISSAGSAESKLNFSFGDAIVNFVLRS